MRGAVGGDDGCELLIVRPDGTESIEHFKDLPQVLHRSTNCTARGKPRAGRKWRPSRIVLLITHPTIETTISSGADGFDEARL